jgi:hypothetical protein
MWILEVPLWHRLFGFDSSSGVNMGKVASVGEAKAKVLPFRYQFAAGAVAGVSEASHS